MNARCTLLVMAKAPVAGYVKTRLIPTLGADGAAALAARLLDHALDQAVAAQLGDVELCCAPDPGHAAFAAYASRADVHLEAQGEGDLGARMARAFARQLAHTERALMIGTDAPALDAAMLRRAAAALEQTDAVFIPAFDGGYALVGLRRAAQVLQRAPGVFDDMHWSTPTVMAETRARLHAAGVRLMELPPVADIDEPADLVHLPDAWRMPNGAAYHAHDLQQIGARP